MDKGLMWQLKRLFEEKTGWGDSDHWDNQDFLELSRMIFDHTGIALSHVTLKRIWGKVRYESLPHTKTLNTIVQFLGYRCWREFRVQNASQPWLSHNGAASRSPAAAAPIAGRTVESCNTIAGRSPAPLMPIAVLRARP